MTILVTGFEPFGGDAENASELAVRRLHGVATAILPVEFERSAERLHELVSELRPRVVVCVGEAGARTRVNVERRARNSADARIADNAGRQPRGEVIDPQADPWLETSFDVDRIAAEVEGVEVSDDAGLFVCNHVYFRALRELAVPVLFVHVPAVRTHGRATVGAETDATPNAAPDATPDEGPWSETGELPSLDDVVRALEAILRSLGQTARQR